MSAPTNVCRGKRCSKLWSTPARWLRLSYLDHVAVCIVFVVLNPRTCLVHRHGSLPAESSNKDCEAYIRKILCAECRVVERTTKELTASAPSGMKSKVVAPPDNILTVGAKRFRCVEVLYFPKTSELPDGTRSSLRAQTLPRRGSVVPAQTNELPDCSVFTVGAERRRMRKCRFINFAMVQEAEGGLAVSKKKPRVPYFEERPGAAHSRRDQVCVAGWAGSAGNRLSLTARSGQEPHTPGGTKCVLRAGRGAQETACP